MNRRILVCVYSHNTWGGIGSWLSGLVRFLAKSGWDVVLGLARGKHYNDPQAISRLFPDFASFDIDGRTGTEEGRVRALCKAMGRYQPDLILPIGLADIYRAVARVKLSGGQVRLVTALHGTNLELFADIAQHQHVIDLCVGVNPIHVSFLAKQYNLDPSILKTIINGVDPCANPRETVLEQPLRIVFVGRLNQEHKRVFDLVPLADELKGLSPQSTITVVGTGESESELRLRAVTHIREGRLRFTGYLEPKQIQTDILPHHDAIVLFSPSEACPLVIQEAMTSGVVPVCTEFVGVHSLGFIQSGRTSLIFGCGDIRSAAEHLAFLANDRVRLAKMSLACRVVSRSFTTDICHRNWLQVLEDIVSKAPRSIEVKPIANDLASRRPNGRLERWLSPGLADAGRRLLRRFPDHANGWAEWPGTLSVINEAMRAKMWQTLKDLDMAAERGRSLVATM